MNVTHWSTCKKHLGSIEADILFIQETKKDQEGSVEAAEAAGRLGWASGFAPARIKEAGLSSGVAILWRRHLDIWLDEGAQVVVPARILAAYARLPGAGVVVLYSVYLDTQGGITGANADHIEKLREHVASHARPWMAIGDWNLSPQELFSVPWLLQVGAVAKATREPTCRVGESRSTIDYAVFGRGLDLAFGMISIQDDVQIATHEAIKVSMLPQATWPKVLSYRARPWVPPDKPIGPRRVQDGSWEITIGDMQCALAPEESLTRCSRQATIDSAYALWRNQAAEDLEALHDLKPGTLEGWGGALQPQLVSLK